MPRHFIPQKLPLLRGSVLNLAPGKRLPGAKVFLRKNASTRGSTARIRSQKNRFRRCRLSVIPCDIRNSGLLMDCPANLSHKSFRFCGGPFWILSQGRSSPGTKVFPPEKRLYAPRRGSHTLAKKIGSSDTQGFPPEKRLYAPRRGSHTLAKKIGSSDTVSLLLPAVAEILDRRWIIPPICPTKASAFAGSRFGFCPGEEAPLGPRFFLRKNACTRQGAARIRSQRKLARQIPPLCYSLR